MKLGINFPQNDIGSDPRAIRDFAQTVEEAGFDYLSTFEHVSGAHPDRFVGIDTGFSAPPYVHHDEFHEPFTLFAYLAGLTRRLEFVTGILVLPQRQTLLVAKQAAEVELLSGGRLRLGVGVGWNHAEYESLNEDFQTRGRRVEEQIELLRRLWAEPLVTFKGRWHNLDRVGIAPRPTRQIPIWLGGGSSDSLLRRVARLADGWMPMLRLADAPEVLARLHGFMAEAGRDPASLDLQVSLFATEGEAEKWVNEARRWQTLGATHLGIWAGSRGLPPMQMLAQTIEVKKVLDQVLN
jgi:probable F420-dependent oxidoreductase